jgi:hypothetical protein
MSAFSIDAESYTPAERRPYANYVARKLDLNKVISGMFNNLKSCRGDEPIYNMMRALYICRPEIFIPIGEVHTNEDGTRTYITMRVHTSNDNYERVHIYGGMRGNYFNITSMEVFNKEMTYVCNFKAKVYGDPSGGAKFWE